MEQQQPTLEEIITSPDFSPEKLGAKFWYEQYQNQKEQYEKLAKKVLELDEELKKLKNRTSKNSSQMSLLFQRRDCLLIFTNTVQKDEF
jgi:hypothetical protein